MKITLQNFKQISSGTDWRVPYKHIAGFNPHYAELASDTVDINMRQKVVPPHSLVLNPRFQTVRRKTGLLPVVLLPNESGELTTVLYGTNKWSFFSDREAKLVGDDTIQTSIAAPTSLALTPDVDAVIFEGKILTGNLLSGPMYSGAINASPSWAEVTDSGSLLTTSKHILRKFGTDRVLVTNGRAGFLSILDQLLYVDPSMTLSEGLTLDDKWNILDFADYKGRYALVFAILGNSSPRAIRETKVFMWDGTPGGTYDDVLSLKGLYVGHIVKDGLIYAFSQVGDTLYAWAFTGVSFQLVNTIKNVTVTTTLYPKMRISVEKDFFVICASSSGNISNGLLYWNPTTQDSFWTHLTDITGVMYALNEAGVYIRYAVRSGVSPFSNNGELLQIFLSEGNDVAKGQSFVSDFYSEDNRSADYPLPFSSGDRSAVSQSFTAQGGYLTNASFMLSKDGSPTGDMIVKLYAHSGTFGTSSVPTTGLPLAESTVQNVAGLSATPTIWAFQFPTPYKLTANTKYCIVFEYEGGDATNRPKVANDGSTPTHGGNAATFESATWTADSGIDLVFAVYEEMPHIGTLKTNPIPVPFFNKPGQPHENATMGRATISSVGVEYKNSPPTANDSVAVTLKTKDEYETETYTDATATIRNTTATSTSARVSDKRSTALVGGKATEFEIEMTLTADSTTWKPIIRRVIAEYDPISMQP